jgi:hypothetical protein
LIRKKEEWNHTKLTSTIFRENIRQPMPLGSARPLTNNQGSKYYLEIF